VVNFIICITNSNVHVSSVYTLLNQLQVALKNVLL